MAEEVGSLKVKVGLNTTEFNQGIATLSKQMQIVSQDFKNASAGLDKLGDASQINRLKITKLSGEIDGQKQIVEQFRIAHQKVADQFGEGSKKALDYELKLKKAEGTLKSMERQLVTATAELKKQESAFTALGTKMNDLSKNCNEFGTKMTSVGKTLSIGVTTPIVGAGVAIGKTAADFEQGMSNIKAVSTATAEEIKKLEEAAKSEEVKKLGYSATEAAQGIEELTKAGVSTSDLLNNGLYGALLLARAGEIELGESAEVASTALNSFKKDGLDVVQVANLLAGGANASATDVRGLQQGLSQVAAVASGVGLSFSDTTTALSLFAQNGLKGSDAGTSLKTMLSRLVPTSKEAKDEMVKLGLATTDGKSAFFDAEGKIKSFADISELLKTKLSGLNQEQRLATLSTIFGSDAVRGANIAFAGGAESVNAMAEAMSKITAEDTATEKMNNFNGQMKQVSATLKLTAIDLGEMLLPMLKDLATHFEKLVNGFKGLNPEIQKLIFIIAGIVAIIGPVIGFIGIMSSAFGAISGVVGAASLAIAEAGGAMTILGGAISLITGPIGITILAIAGLVASVVNLWKTNEEFRNKVEDIWGDIKTIITSIADSITTYWEGEWGEKIKSILTNIWNVIKAIFQTAIQVIADVLGMVLDIMTGDWAGAWGHFKDIFIDLWSGIKTIITNAFEGLVSIFSVIGNNIINGLINGISSRIEAVKETITNLANSMPSWIKNILGIHSPSTVFAEIGGNISAGLAQGITEGTGQVLASMDAQIAAVEARLKAESANLTAIQKQQITEQAAIERASLEQAIADADNKIQILEKEGAAEDKLTEAKKKAVEARTKLAEYEAKAVVDATQDQLTSLKKQQSALKDYQDLLADAKQVVADYYADMAAAAKEYQDAVDKVNQKLAEDEASLTEAYQNELASRADAIANFVGLFDEITNKEVSGDTLLKNLQDQVTAIETWRNNLASLANRGIDTGLLTELEGMGPSAAGEIAALNTLTDEQLTQYVALWREKQGAATAIAEEYSGELYSEYQQSLSQLNLEAAEQLETLRSEWETKNADILKNTTEKLNEIETKFKDLETASTGYGVSIMTGFIAGIESQFDALRATIEEMASIVQSGLTTELEIQSPSKVMAEIGKNISLGLAEGITGATSAVKNSLNGLLSTMIYQAKGGIDATSGIAYNTTNNSGGNTIHIHVSGMSKELEKTLRKLGVKF